VADAWSEPRVDPPVRAPDGAHRPEADRRAARGTERATAAPQPRAAAAQRRRPRRRARSPIDDFAKVDLRIARIVNAEHVDGADKLLEAHARRRRRRQRTVFAGIKSAYRPRTCRPADADGRESRAAQDEVRLSEGMVLAASGDGPASSCSRPTAARSRACASSDAAALGELVSRER
jgi:tRNA-binding EMAP/Myf-like protein